MGRDSFHPRRGSLAYSPRKRAKDIVARIRSWVNEDKVRMQGFAGYKAGMTHVMMIDDYKHSPTYGEEVFKAVTVIDAPPLKVFGIRAYVRENGALRSIKEVWAENLSKDLGRVFQLPKKLSHDVEDIEKILDEVAQIRLLVHTQPRLSGLGKKTPEVMEYLVSGNIKDAFNYAKDVLGKEIRAKDIFEEGEYVDVIAVTKGKGFQSSVKRWGVKLLHHKTRKGRRRAGTLGPRHPAAVMWTVPQSGQVGFHQRTEYNKRILIIGENGEEITPKGGFVGYGIIKGDYIVLEGSVPGARKRLIRLRPAIRLDKYRPFGKPNITYISLESKQGV